MAAAPLIEVPFKRVLNPPVGETIITGSDVKALKRVVSRSGNWQWQEFNQQYTSVFAKGYKKKIGGYVKGEGGVAKFQSVLGLPQTGIWDLKTHNKSLTYKVPKDLPHAGEWIWDQFAQNQYNGQVVMTAAQKIVAEIFHWWQYLVDNDPAWHYAEVRPIYELVQKWNPPHLPGTSDCSGTSIYMAFVGGAISPDVHYGFSGAGNTDSLVTGGFQIAEADIAKYCQNYYVLAFYGPHDWDTSHVTAVKSASENYSHGKEDDPTMYNSIHYRSDFLQLRAYPVI